MGVVETNQFHKGLKIEYEGEIWEIIEYRHSKIFGFAFRASTRNFCSSQ